MTEDTNLYPEAPLVPSLYLNNLTSNVFDAIEDSLQEDDTEGRNFLLRLKRLNVREQARLLPNGVSPQDFAYPKSPEDEARLMALTPYETLPDAALHLSEDIQRAKTGLDSPSNYLMASTLYSTLSLFRFPLFLMVPRYRALSAPAQMPLRIAPIKTIMRLGRDPNDFITEGMKRQLSTNGNAFRAESYPYTLQLQAVYENPALVLGAMIERSKHDIAGTVGRVTELRSIAEFDESDVAVAEMSPETPVFYKEHPLMQHEGMHAWTPGQVLATAQGAERLLPFLIQWAIAPRNPAQEYRVVSTVAALALQRIELREAQWFLTGLFRQLGWPDSQRSRWDAQSSGPQGGYGGHHKLSVSGHHRYAVRQTSNSWLARSIQDGYTYSDDPALHGMSLHKRCQQALVNIAVDERMARFNRNKEAFLTVMAEFLTTTDDVAARRAYFSQKIEEVDQQLLRSGLSQAETTELFTRNKVYTALRDGRKGKRDLYPKMREAHFEYLRKFSHEKTDTIRFLEATMQDELAYRTACKLFEEDQYELTFTGLSDTLRERITEERKPEGKRQRLSALTFDNSVEVWLFFFVHQAYIGRRPRRMTAEEHLGISIMTGVPVTAFIDYYYRFMERTGLVICSGKAGDSVEALIEDVIDLLYETEQLNMSIQLNDLIEELEQLKAYGTALDITVDGKDVMEKRSVADTFNRRGSNPLDMVQLGGVNYGPFISVGD